jgi:hypothetical protein
MFLKRYSKGQSIALIAFAMIGLVGITALAIDGGNAFSIRRRAQSAVDNAALAAALAKVNGQNLADAALAITRTQPSYGFPDSEVIVQNPPGPDCSGLTPNPVKPTDPATPYDVDNINFYIQVIIHSNVDTYFGSVIGHPTLAYCVQAIARAKPSRFVPPFYGDAIVGLAPTTPDDPDILSYYDQSNATDWNIWGGGIFANNNASDTHSNVVFHNGQCATSVGTAVGFTCSAFQNRSDLFIDYPDDVPAFMPPTPACDGIAYVGDDDKIYPEEGHELSGSRIASFAGDYTPGVYCITDAGGVIHSEITGVGVTFYIEDTDFTMKFDGFGALAAQAPTDPDNPYKGVLIFSSITDEPCTQNIMIRGNGSTPIVGSILMPSACVDYRGNGTGDNMNSQVVGYIVSSNGEGDVDIHYDVNDNYLYKEPPLIELTR